MKEIMIQRGKVIRVPADEIKLKDSQHFPYIVGDADKVRSVIDLLKVIQYSTCPEFPEWETSEIDSQYESLVSASNIAELLEGAPELIQDAFGKAKFIVQIEMNSEKFNYFYIVENLPEEWSLLDAIGCIVDANRIQKHCSHMQDTLDVGRSTRPLVFEFNDYSLPIVKISHSDARYIAKDQDAIYYSTPSNRIASRINHFLAQLMVAEMEYTEDEKVKLIHPIKSIGELFSFFTENNELKDRLDKARLIRSLGIEDDEYEYFYLVEGKSALGVTDIMGHQKDISVAIASSEYENPKNSNCINCPFRPEISFNYLTQRELDEFTDDIEYGNIENHISDIYGKSGKLLYDLILTIEGIENNAELQDRINNTLINQLKKKFNPDLTPVQITVKKTDDHDDGKKLMNLHNKDNEELDLYSCDTNKAQHSAHVLIVHSLYSICSTSKTTIFPFKKKIKDSEGVTNLPPGEVEIGKKVFSYNKSLAILYGLFYNSFCFSSSRNTHKGTVHMSFIDLLISFDKNLGDYNIFQKMEKFKDYKYGIDIRNEFYSKCKEKIYTKSKNNNPVDFICKYIQALGTNEITDSVTYLDVICHILENIKEIAAQEAKNIGDKERAIYEALCNLNCDEKDLYSDYEDLIKVEGGNDKQKTSYHNIERAVFKTQSGSKYVDALPQIQIVTNITGNTDYVGAAFKNLCELFKALFRSWTKQND